MSCVIRENGKVTGKNMFFTLLCYIFSVLIKTIYRYELKNVFCLFFLFITQKVTQKHTKNDRFLEFYFSRKGSFKQRVNIIFMSFSIYELRFRQRLYLGIL